ncbi:hypothetical protein GCM10011380_29710 [Sphingomonas metalli]|uniref:DUF3291 domain-containing protein n=1 Tax=Sphingomonas metalli TaxID=1779358 RepID=A0A916TCH9_9SPHN|nr:DUF3291 domain-containing protein [Sphingomonas metalli]GGB38365.1 hypothetical protein GCM10011380_29710 [Sphingomonas metalli]
MGFVSVTRLRLRSVRFLPGFAWHTRRTLAQIRVAEGYRAGQLLADRRFAFWTVTLWRDPAAMRGYMASGAHLQAMPRLMHWCDEASVVHWPSEADGLPDWDEIDRRMRAEGRPSKVRHPTPDHAGLGYAPPRTTGVVPIARR